MKNLLKIKKLIARRRKVGLDKVKFDNLEGLNNLKGTYKRLLRYSMIVNEIENPFLISPQKTLSKQVVKRKKPNTSSKKKTDWISKIRCQRKLLKTERNNLSKRGLNYRNLYLKVKGNYFKNQNSLLKYISKNEEI